MQEKTVVKCPICGRPFIQVPRSNACPACTREAEKNSGPPRKFYDDDPGTWKYEFVPYEFLTKKY